VTIFSPTASLSDRFARAFPLLQLDDHSVVSLFSISAANDAIQPLGSLGKLILENHTMILESALL